MRRVHQPDGTVHHPDGVRLGVRGRSPEDDGLTPRDVALVYLFAFREKWQPTRAELPCSPEEMAAALNRAIEFAGPELVIEEVQVPEQDAARDDLMERVGDLLGGLKVGLFGSAAVGSEREGDEPEVVMPQGPDGEAAQERPDGAAIRLARAILDEQLKTGDARISWGSRGSSRELRTRLARVILDAADALGDLPVGDGEWLLRITEAIYGKIEQPERLAGHAARAILRLRMEDQRRGRVESPGDVSEAATTAPVS